MIPPFFMNKINQEMKLDHGKNTYLRKLGFSIQNDLFLNLNYLLTWLDLAGIIFLADLGEY